MSMAIPIPVSVKGEDGSEFKVRLKGDEFISWYEDTSGNVLTKDDDGVVRYSDFKKDHFEAGEALSKKSRRKRLTKTELDTNTRKDIAEFGRRCRCERGYPDACDLHKKIRGRKKRESKTAPNILATKITMSQVTPATSVSSAQDDPDYVIPGANSIPFPVLLVFVKFASSGAFKETELTDAELEDLFFGPRFSVASWYKANTNGAVNVSKVTNVVHLTLPGTLQDFGKNNAITRAGLELPALDALVASGFNFAPYETVGDDGSLVVDPEKLCVVLLVHSYDSSGGYAPGVWGHAYIGYAGWDTPNGAKLMSLQTYGTYSMPNTKLPIGLAIHEGAHARFYLPDLYAIDGSHSGLGMYSIMASGSWGSSPYARGKNAGDCPACFDPLSLMLIDENFVNERVSGTGTFATYFGNDNSLNTSLINTPNANEFFAVQWRGCALNINAQGEMATEMYDACLIDWWKATGAIASYIDQSTPKSTLSCNVVYHIDLSQPNNIVAGKMLCCMLEMHGGVQNLVQPTGGPQANYTDPQDPASLYSTGIAFNMQPAPEFLAGPLDAYYDPPLKMNDGTALDLKLTAFVSTIDGMNSTYTIPGLNPDPPDYSMCYICDRPKVYQVKNW